MKWYHQQMWARRKWVYLHPEAAPWMDGPHRDFDPDALTRWFMWKREREARAAKRALK